MELQRIIHLSGMHPNSLRLQELKADRQKVLEAYDKLINDAEQNRQLDEGLFTSLKAMLATVGAAGAAGAKKVAEKVKNLSDKVKELYLDEKAKIELGVLIKNMKKAIADFETIEKDASTIVARDEEVNKAMETFKKLFSATIDMLGARQAVAKGVTEGVEVDEELLEAIDPDSDVVVSRDKQLEFKKGFKKKYKHDKFYFDDVDLVDEKSSKTIAGVTLNKSKASEITAKLLSHFGKAGDAYFKRGLESPHDPIHGDADFSRSPKGK